MFLRHGIQVALNSSNYKGKYVPPMEIQMGESTLFPNLLIDLNNWLLIMSTINEDFESYFQICEK